MENTPDYDVSDELEYTIDWFAWILRGHYPPPASATALAAIAANAKTFLNWCLFSIVSSWKHGVLACFNMVCRF